jgi:nucleotide-binding universal stress UspA family protein
MSETMYETILVPLDGSRRAEAILPHVEEMAANYGSAVVFLRVFEIPHITPIMSIDQEQFGALPHMTPEELQALVEEAENYLRDVCHRLTGCGINGRFRIEYGPIAATIINTAEQENADLIAMASHGSSGLEGVYYGSVAAGVLQRVDRPLLIVRAYETE